MNVCDLSHSYLRAVARTLNRAPAGGNGRGAVAWWIREPR